MARPTASPAVHDGVMLWWQGQSAPQQLPTPADTVAPSAAVDRPRRAVAAPSCGIILMLELSAEQTSSLQQAAREAFIDEMAAHLAAFSPPHARALGVAGLRPVIGVGMDRAANHGLTWRGPVRLYLELMCLFGSFFADDPQLPAPARAVLADQACDQLERAQSLRRILSGHFAQIFGQQGQGPGRREILTRLRDRVGEPPPVRGPRPEDALLALLAPGHRNTRGRQLQLERQRRHLHRRCGQRPERGGARRPHQCDGGCSDADRDLPLRQPDAQ